MNTVRNAILCTMVLLLTGVAIAQGTYTQIDFPNAGSTYCMGIDSSAIYPGFMRIQVLVSKVSLLVKGASPV